MTFPCNARPDRLDCEKGYEGNVELTCVACNLLRGKNSVEGNRRHVRRIVKAWREGRCQVVNDVLVPILGGGFVGAPTPVEEARIWAWAEEEWERIDDRCKQSQTSKRRKPKANKLTVQDLFDMLVARWAGDGKFLDVTGAAFDLWFVSVDRLNSEDDYTVANSRLMHSGLNFLKNTNSNDYYCRSSSGSRRLLPPLMLRAQRPHRQMQ
ncbi:hypothetical protein BDZ90DRAFT_74203 [Jaminaea rosea]|uniref:Uncharacterized protein n=1 Tax=Jaminaea rosea TaxID=1569628 RepID=A0A316ULW3_9BASI|nr:hypothetical protein BDZ90DRAFT_74203 [Jaminaea rosea]PWN25371.1 hypothetical protein BDZ90DRAFT_74203 [Jaminaea rosea]